MSETNLDTFPVPCRMIPVRDAPEAPLLTSRGGASRRFSGLSLVRSSEAAARSLDEALRKASSVVEV